MAFNPAHFFASFNFLVWAGHNSCAFPPFHGLYHPFRDGLLSYGKNCLSSGPQHGWKYPHAGSSDWPLPKGNNPRHHPQSFEQIPFGTPKHLHEKEYLLTDPESWITSFSVGGECRPKLQKLQHPKAVQTCRVNRVLVRG